VAIGDRYSSQIKNNYFTEMCSGSEAYTSQIKNNYFTEMCSGSEAGTYFSTLDLQFTKKRSYRGFDETVRDCEVRGGRHTLGVGFSVEGLGFQV